MAAGMYMLTAIAVIHQSRMSIRTGNVVTLRVVVARVSATVSGVVTDGG